MNTHSIFSLLLIFFVLAACSSGEEPDKEQASTQSNEGLSQFEKEHGIGPYTDTVSLDEINPSVVTKGEKIFEQNCSACHKIDERYVGPELGNVLNRRSPTFVLNMILNPDGMVKKHPEVKAMLAQYYTPMPNQNLSQDQALAVLEYLRSETK